MAYVPSPLRKQPPSEEPGPRHARLQSTPSSCYSDWDSSLWSTWSSVMDGNVHSTRTSLISSVDSCYTNDSTAFGRWLAAAAAESVSGASLSGEAPTPGAGLKALFFLHSQKKQEWRVLLYLKIHKFDLRKSAFIKARMEKKNNFLFVLTKGLYTHANKTVA